MNDYWTSTVMLYCMRTRNFWYYGDDVDNDLCVIMCYLFCNLYMHQYI